MDEQTGKSKGFGFVEMALENEAEIVIKALHGSKLSKNMIRVKPAS
jgi:RNA recognition motif-containing protein